MKIYRRSAVLFVSLICLLSGLIAIQARTPASASDTGGAFVPVTSYRLADSRANVGGFGTTPVAGGETRTVVVAGRGGVPATGANAVIVDVTVINPSASTWLVLWASGTSRPGTSNINVPPGQTVSNSAIVPLGADGSIQVRNASGTTDVTVDLQGYFTTTGPGAGYSPLSTRVLDTRSGAGAPGGVAAPLAPGASITIDAHADASMPLDVTSVFANFTALNTSTAGHLTVYPSGATPPSNATIDFDGTPSSNTAIAVLSSDGKMVVKNTGSTYVDLVVDLQGYFTPANTGGSFNPIATRLYDSRDTQALAAGSSIDIPVAGLHGIDDGPSAVALNILTKGASGGFLQEWPTGDTSLGAASLVQFNANENTTNLTFLMPGEDQSVTIKNVSSSPVLLVIDAQGWFSSPRVGEGGRDACVAAAAGHVNEFTGSTTGSWTCFDGGLAYEQPSSGGGSTWVDEPVLPPADPDEDAAVIPPDPSVSGGSSDPFSFTDEAGNTIAPPAIDYELAPNPDTTESISDDYACEPTGSCFLSHTAHAAAVKYNLWFGTVNRNGVKVGGNFDIIWRQSTNGPRWRYKVELIWDAGQAASNIQFESTIKQSKTLAPDPTKGTMDFGPGANVLTFNHAVIRIPAGKKYKQLDFKVTTTTITYYDNLNGYFTAGGRRYSTPTGHTGYFKGFTLQDVTDKDIRYTSYRK